MSKNSDLGQHYINLHTKEEDSPQKELIASVAPTSSWLSRPEEDYQAELHKTMDLHDLKPEAILDTSRTIEEVSNKIFFLEREISDLQGQFNKLNTQVEMGASSWEETRPKITRLGKDLEVKRSELSILKQQQRELLIKNL